MSSEQQMSTDQCERDLMEQQIDQYLPELCLLFRMAGVRVKKSDSVLLNFLVFAFMWIIGLLMIGVYIKLVHDDKSPHFSQLAEIYWAFHSCIVYTILSYTMHNDSQVFKMILLSVQKEVDEWRCSMVSNNSANLPNSDITSTQNSLRKVSKYCVYIVLFCVTFNVTMLIIMRFNIFLSQHLPWSDSILFNLLGVFAWYFYSLHWFTAVVCVYLPVHFFSQKVKLFVHYLEYGLNDFDRNEVIKAMEWYDDLYKINKLMNFESLSLLTTTSLLMLMLLLIALLLSVFKDSKSVKFDVIFWICTNLIVTSCMAFTVAELEASNKKILIEVASIRSSYQFNAEDINLQQMVIMKVNSLPFGIYIFGTRKLITFDSIAALVSILGSMFLLIVGTNANNS